MTPRTTLPIANRHYSSELGRDSSGWILRGTILYAYTSEMDNYTDLPKSRAEAARLGAKKYFTGKPCSNGHIAPRYAVGCCTECMKAAQRNWHSQHPAKQAEYARRCYAKNPDGPRQRSLKYARAKLPTPTRPSPAACECCGKVFSKTPRLDHDHATGAFRGWLCDTCNRGIGMFGDTLAGVMRAVNYLAGR